MPDLTPMTEDWLGKSVTAAIGAVLTFLGTVFMTRKNSETALADRLNARIDAHMERQDETLARQGKELQDCHDRHRECEENWQASNAKLTVAEERLGALEALFTSKPANHDGVDFAAGQRLGRQAQARRKGDGE